MNGHYNSDHNSVNWSPKQLKSLNTKVKTTDQPITDSNICAFFPVKTVQMHPKDKQWMTNQIKNLIDQRQKAFAKNDHPRRIKLRNKIIREIKKSK